MVFNNLFQGQIEQFTVLLVTVLEGFISYYVNRKWAFAVKLTVLVVSQAVVMCHVTVSINYVQWNPLKMAPTINDFFLLEMWLKRTKIQVCSRDIWITGKWSFAIFHLKKISSVQLTFWNQISCESPNDILSSCTCVHFGFLYSHKISEHISLIFPTIMCQLGHPTV